MIPGNINTDLISGAEGAYQVERSLRFNSADSAYLSRTPASAGNRRTWTYSCWVKRSGLGTDQALFDASNGSPNDQTRILFDSNNKISFSNIDNNSVLYSLITTPVYRDTSAWMHIVVAVDTTQSTASDRQKIYVNGTQVTTFDTANYPALNYETHVSRTYAHGIGRSGAYSGFFHFSGYLAEIHFIDGQALTPSSFAETNATTGQWVPKAYTGSYGTNGFRLDFSNPFDLGNDAAGANDWTPSNLSGVSGGPTSVAAASGALPIYNTTDTYGATKGSGTRTDANSSSIVLAIPMDGANNGTTFTDESATIKGSGSAKTITRNGAPITSTAISKYYGSSGYFNGSSYLTLPSGSDFVFTGNFTVECWAYPTSISSVLDGLFSLSVLADWNNVEASGNTGLVLSVGALHWGNSTSQNYATGSIRVNSWTHLAVSRSGSTITVYINGASALSVSYSGTIGNSATQTPGIGRFDGRGGGRFPFTGYIQDLRIYNGTAKYTSSFIPPNNPQQAALIGAGNDSLVDTPTSYGTDTGAGGEVRGNYATLNPLDQSGSNTFSNGNLDVVVAADNNTPTTVVCGSISVSSGKWYWEVTPTAMTTAGGMIGIGDFGQSPASRSWRASGGWYYYGNNGQKYNNGSGATFGASYANNDVIGVALDLDAGTVVFYKNGTTQGTAYTTGLTGKFIGPVLANGTGGGTQVYSVNFGQRPFAYTAPSGFKALCDTSLPAPTIARPSTVMDVRLYTGNGSTQTVSGLGFSPDLVWIKGRSTSSAHNLYDSIRGRAALFSNATNAELALAAGKDFDTFTSDGFTLLTPQDTAINNSGVTFAAWTWDAGSSTATNTQGSITSQVRANASAGFSVVSFTGAGGSQTVGHGLGVTPAMIIAKNRATTNSWAVWFTGFTANEYLVLNSTGAKASFSSQWGSTPTSTVFGVADSSVNGSGNGIIAYCFAPVAGYSAFGSYTGNGSADGPFVFTGFRPRWVLIKGSSFATTGWAIYDAVRNTFNVANNLLTAESSSAETNYPEIDLLSNGFKLRGTNPTWNYSGQTHIYAAFAENPFQYARAR